MPHPRHLLIRGVNWLGDAVMTTPALLRLRETLPDTRLTLVTPAKLAELWPGHPALNDVVSLPHGESPRRVGQRLHPLGADTVLVLPNSPRAALEAWFARVPRRIGLAHPLRTFLLTDAVRPRPGSLRMHKATPADVQARLRGDASRSFVATWDAHHTHHYLHLAATLGATPVPTAPHLYVNPAECDEARQKFDLPSAGGPWVAINAGAEYGPAKRWPVDHFIAAARKVAGTARVGWVVLGGPADLPIASGIANQLPGSRLLAGRTSLRELMAVLALCRVVLTNDTGPMHVAAAVGTPVVVPFGSTSPELTGPGLPRDPRHHLLRTNAPCAPCFRRECPIDLRCLLGITPERAAAAVLDVLRSPDGG